MEALKARAALAALLLGAGATGLEAGKTPDPGQRTFWDEMMRAQSRRDLVRGVELLEERSYAGAVKEFAKAVIAAPGDPDAHRMLGVAYYWTGQVEAAEVELTQSLRLDPESAQTHLLLGIVHAWKGGTQESYRAFQEAARRAPDRADIQMNLGSIEETLGLVSEALTHFRRAVALDKEHPLYRFQLGTLYRRLGRDEEAADELEAAIAKFPGYQEAMLELGALYERMGRHGDAAALFKKAVKLKTRDAVARFRLARAYVLAGKEEDARDALRDVFHLTPEDRGGGLQLSLSYGGRAPPPGAKDPGGAPPPAGGKPAAPPPAGPPPPEASDPLEVLARNLARIPLDQEAALNVDLAFIPVPKLVKSSAPGEAPSSLKAALERAGRPQGVVGARREYRLPGASAPARAAEVRRVVEDLRSAMASAPPGSEVRFGMNLSFTPASASPPGGEPKARVSYQPHDVGNDLGLWVMGTGWMALVEEVLSEPTAPPGRPAGRTGWVAQGVGWAVLGNHARALGAFDRALAADPKDELAQLGRGVALVISGREDAAVAAYRRALELDPGSKTASQALEWLSRPDAGAASGGKP